MGIILGISAFHAGASACLVIDGVPVIAIAEERLNRIKYYAGFPELAIRACLEFGGLKISDIEHVAVGRDPGANKLQKMAYAVSNPEKLTNLLSIRRKAKRFRNVKTLIADTFGMRTDGLHFTLHNVEHHIAHTASAYFVSPWEKAAGFSIDGSGDFATCLLSKCEGSEIELISKTFVPNSLGSLYTMVSQFIGLSTIRR